MGSKSQDHYKIKELRKVLHSHNLMSGTSSDAWDPMISKILDRIDEGIDFDVLVEFIHHELVVTYGFYSYEVNAKEIAESIEAWWLNYTESHS